MKPTFKLIGILSLILLGTFAHAQTDKEKAIAKGKEAIELMDSGKIDESIKLLEEAQKMAPDVFFFSYEIALAHYYQKDYKGAAKTLEKVRDHKDVEDVLFQLLGNAYDVLGKTDKALDAYDEGLKKFPNSGRIYLEKGNLYVAKKDYDKAITFYEKGIEVDPKHPSNYYRAAQLYLSSAEEVWGMIYGEIFINLEYNTQRTEEMSKMLYDTYKSEIKIKWDSASVSFSKQAAMTIDDVKDIGKMKFPFGIFAYEPTLSLSVIGEKEIDLNSLDRIRDRFVENYYSMGNDKKYPNVLFEFHHKLLELGHLEAYNHWALMGGDTEGFESWKENNPEKWNGFVDWFNQDGLVIDKEHKFYREQY